MDIQQTAQELQKCADANGLEVDASSILNTMDAGDFLAINQAMDQSDNRTIIQLLQKYKGRMSESFKFFNGKHHLDESNELLCKVHNMNMKELAESYAKFSAYSDTTFFSTQELKALVYEDVASNLKANQIVGRNTTTQQQNVNPQTQNKMKQAELQRNANNNAMQVTVPGNQSGTDNVEPVVGVDIGPTPQQTLVVTKNSSKPNQVNVYGLDDVNPIQQQGQVNMSEEFTPQEINQELMNNPEDVVQNDTPSPLTHTAPGMGELIQAIAHVEKEDDVYGDGSPMANDGTEQDNEIIDQIIDFCSRMRGR